MAGRRNPPRQRGVALLMLLVLAVLAGSVWLIKGLATDEIEKRRRAQTQSALLKAREAIIGYMLKFRDHQALNPAQQDRVYGYLPMPDLGSSRNQNSVAGCGPTVEGCSANTPTDIIPSNYDNTYPTLIGRVPWRTLGIEPLRDGYGECLWLIVAAPHLSGNADPINRANSPEMNWDTLGQVDIRIADGTSLGNSVIGADLSDPAGREHDRPVAILFAPGPALGAQNRGTSDVYPDEVGQCGGNYDASNYLDAKDIAKLNNLSNYLAGTNAASGETGDRDRSNDPDDGSVKATLIHGPLARAGNTFVAGNCKSGDCDIVANDFGLPITNVMLFSALRKKDYFRSDLNDLLTATGECLANAGAFTPEAIGGTHASGRYGRTTNAVTCTAWTPTTPSADLPGPPGHFRHYREHLFTARVGDIADCQNNFAEDGKCFDLTLFGSGLEPPQVKKCHGVALLAGERLEKADGPRRRIEQPRVSVADRNAIANYLEDANLASFQNGGLKFAGASTVGKPGSSQLPSQDVLRCLPASGYSEDNQEGAGMLAVQNAMLGGTGKQLARFEAASGILTLGQKYADSDAAPATRELYGCAWETETHAMGAGFRRYFNFNIKDALTLSVNPFDGFTLAIVDADNNGLQACGAARQHLGYSGNNGDTPLIAPPKIGIEFDLRRQGTTYPTSTDPLNNGRNDPSSTTYPGGHVGLVYWGGESTIPYFSTTFPADNDDNVHGRGGSGCPASPQNPVPPVSPTLASGVYKLDPNLSAVPVNTDFHVRVELTRPSPGVITLPTVNVAATGNVTLAAPGSSIDGITLRNGDRVLLWAQTNAAENGIYVWQGPSQTMLRATDFDDAAELAGAIVQVTQGKTHLLTSWYQATSAVAPGTSALRWNQIPVKFAVTSMNVAAPGIATIDGIPLDIGDRVLIISGANNGLWVYKGMSTPMSRAAEAATIVAGMAVRVGSGSLAGHWWRYDSTTWLDLADPSRSVRFAVQGNIDLATTNAPSDGCVTASSGDRLLLKDQSNARENGIYVWNGAGSLVSGRATDANSADELVGRLVQVAQGTDAGRTFRQTRPLTDDKIDIDPVAWSALDPLVQPQYLIEVWLLPQSDTDAQRIAAMKDTSRPMRQHDGSFTPHLRDQPRIYQPFRNVRFGMTVGQRDAGNDQTVTVDLRQRPTWLD